MVEAYKPVTLKEALEIRSLKDTMIHSGGTDIMVKYRGWSGTIVDFPKDILIIGHLRELQEISIENAAVKIGAAVTFSQILKDKRIPDYIKLPISNIGSPSIRNLGTIGGNVCNSSPAGDSLPMLYALDAELTIESKDKTYTDSISNFITGPGKNILKGDEILKYVTIPLREYNKVYYRKVGQRKANSISKVSFFAVANVDNSEIKEVRIAVGAVSPTVIRSLESENLLKSIKKDNLPKAIDEVMANFKKLINPIDDVRSTKEYRRKVSMNLIENFLLNL